MMNPIRGGRVLPGFLGVVGIGLLLYLPFLSRHFDLNGIAEARCVDLQVLFSANHMLYRPAAWFLFRTSRMVGFGGRSVTILQIFTALCSGFGMGFSYLAFSFCGRRKIVAAIMAFFLGTSWAYWAFATDAAYITPAAMCVSAGLAAFFKMESLSSAAFAGFLTAISVLMFEADIFLIPVFAFGLLFTRRALPFRTRIILLGALFGTCMVVVIGCYVAVGVFAFGYRNAASLFGWIFKYQGANLPMWGHFDVTRIPIALHTAVKSIIPLGDIISDNETCMALTIVFLVILAWPLVKLLGPGGRGTKAGQFVWLPWLLSGYLIFLAFIVWWDPWETKWFVVPNIFLAASLALYWDQSIKTLSDISILAVCVAVLSFANFESTIFPRRTTPNHWIQVADCVSLKMSDTDLFLATDWSWSDYMRYFHDREEISLIGAASYFPSKDLMLDAVRQRIVHAQQSGGSVYMTDIGSYSSEHMEWLRTQIGLTAEDLAKFASESAFDCYGTKIRKLSVLRK